MQPKNMSRRQSVHTAEGSAREAKHGYVNEGSVGEAKCCYVTEGSIGEAKF